MNNHDLKRRPRIAKLRRECAKLIRELRAVEADPLPQEDPCSAFRDALKKSVTLIDIRATSPTSNHMNVTAQIATSYGIGREHVYRLQRRHGLTIDDLTNPDLVFEKLLEGRKSKLRARLLNPATRETIREEIELAAIRGPMPDTQSKIKSIQ